jgi:hypothetical protein
MAVPVECSRFTGDWNHRFSREPAWTAKPTKVPKQGKPNMVKRIILGVVYTVVLYVVACGLVGGIAGGIAGSKDPQNAAAAGARASAEVVLKYRLFIFLGACAIGVAGTATGALPGTRKKVRVKKSGPTSGVLSSRRSDPPPMVEL